MTLEMNDLASKRYRKVISLRVPQADIKVHITTSTSLQNWLEAASLSGDANVDIYLAPAGWQESACIQEEYIHAQDILTGRAHFLFDKLLPQRSDGTSHKWFRHFLPLMRRRQFEVLTGMGCIFHSLDCLLSLLEALLIYIGALMSVCRARSKCIGEISPNYLNQKATKLYLKQIVMLV